MHNDIVLPSKQRAGEQAISLASRRQRPVIAWLTGLSGAGKTSIAMAATHALSENGRYAVVLDGDRLRGGLCRDLGFSSADRDENVRRAAEVALLMAETGLIVVVALISPFRTERRQARDIAGDVPFLEIFVDTSLPVCRLRDPKGLYARAEAGELAEFTGVSSPYEAPISPDLILPTENLSVADSARPLIDAILNLSGEE